MTSLYIRDQEVNLPCISVISIPISKRRSTRSIKVQSSTKSLIYKPFYSHSLEAKTISSGKSVSLLLSHTHPPWPTPCIPVWSWACGGGGTKTRCGKVCVAILSNSDSFGRKDEECFLLFLVRLGGFPSLTWLFGRVLRSL